MRQPRYNSLITLVAGGGHASSGAGAHATELDLTLGTKPAIDAVLNPLTTQSDAYTVATGELATLRRLLNNQQDETYNILFSSRDLLRRSLGNQYSTAWTGTGFTFSLRVPRSVARLQGMARTLKAYLVANPEMERAELMTAALIGTALDNLTNAENAVKLKKSAVGTLLALRKQKEKALRRHLRWVVDELGRVIDPMDDRWTAFGFNKPGLKQTPAVPTGLAVVLMNNVAASVKWSKAARAEYYRVWIKVNGVDLTMQSVGSPADLDFTIENLPPNSVIEIAVCAVNNGGQSALSQVVTVTTA
ncbi:MAG: fibronectin type III domain-containing protein [Verrucomicrobia bacterium]|nr:fibronectin type III domain-containing protein [Verrucomicrobiota bacterium]